MLSDAEQELLGAFSEVRVIGQDMADRINTWNEANLDEDNTVSVITQDMSGDTVISSYTEHGEEESTIVKMLISIGYSETEESDDTVVKETEIKKNKDISDWLNEFLLKCMEVAEKYPNLIGAIELLAGNSQRKEGVRISIPSDVDIRKLPSKDNRKMAFMSFLKDIREESRKYSMIDEAFCFCSKKNEFLVVLHPYKNGKN